MTQLIIKTNMISLQWKNLNLVHKKTQKKILRNINGKVESKDFLTIMGASGAGKTTFLSILTGRITPSTNEYEFSGNVALNHNKMSLKLFQNIGAYVRQQDTLLNNLTVLQILTFHAQLKLLELSEEQRIQKINMIILQLNLEECKNNIVGSMFEKCLSGGQIKRVSIGLELLSDPDLIVLDEPTSGLDSHNALKLMRVLKNLCQLNGKTIITTIHQPSYLVFLEMDKLLLLNEGKTCYFGKANSIMEYMNSIGLKNERKMNPPDFFIEQLSNAQRGLKSGYESPMNSQNFEKYQLKMIENPEEKIKEGSLKYYMRKKNNSYDQLLKKIFILVKRSRLCFVRNLNNSFVRLVCTICNPIFIGITYLNIADQIPQDSTDYLAINLFLQDFCCFVFMCLLVVHGMNVYITVQTFPNEKHYLYKEVNSKIYPIWVYYISRFIIEIPYSVASAIFMSLGMYFLAGFEISMHLFFFVLMLILQAFTGFSLGMLIGIIFQSAQLAVTMLSVFMVPVFLFAGLIVNLSSIPIYASWMQYLSPLRHGYVAIISDQLETNLISVIGPKEKIMQLLGIQGTLEISFIYLGSLFCVISLLAVVFLYALKPVY